MIAEDIGLWAACVLFALLMFYVAKNIDFSLNQHSRLIFGIPFVLVLWFVATAGFEISLMGIYAGSLILIGCFFLKNKKQMNRVLLAGLVCIMMTPVICFHYKDYRITHYTDEFRSGFAIMRERYVLKDYKNVDFDALYAKYLPKFEAADEARNFPQAYAAWMDFTFEFFDGHVYVTAGGSEAEIKSNRDAYYENQVGMDYGFSLVTLADGRTVFANVDQNSGAYALGIRDGLEITGFDGADIQTAKERTKQVLTMADRENAAFYQSLMVTASGGEQADITFLDENGAKQSVTVSGAGNYFDRFKKTFDQLRRNNEETNLSYKMISDDIAIMYLNEKQER